MWCSPCAPLCSSLCSIQRDTPQFAYPVPSRCLLRALRLQLQWFRAPVFKLLDEGAGLISSAFPWRNDTVRSPDEHFQRKTLTLFFFSFRLIFTQNVGRAFSARRSASYSNSRLTEGEIPTPFSSSAPSGTRGVCMQKVVCQGKVRLIFTPYILLFFFFFFF